MEEEVVMATEAEGLAMVVVAMVTVVVVMAMAEMVMVGPSCCTTCYYTM